jgi:phenylalanyl-tRNA synthetase beta chain
MENPDRLTVSPPSFRVDLEREADLVEEVARLYGYNNIPATLPEVTLSYPEQDSNRVRRLAIAERLTSAGYTEAINYSFGSDKHAGMMNIAETDERFQTVRLLNPLSEVMRTMLLPGLLENVRRNINHQKTAVKMFEIGKIFTPAGNNVQPREATMLCGVLSGNRHGESSPLHYKPEPVDIFDAKGGVEFIVNEMGIGRIGEELAVRFVLPEEGSQEPFAEHGHSLDLFIGSLKIGSLGKITTEVLRRFAIKHEVYYFDLPYDRICEQNTLNKHFSSLPVFPSVKRDIALVVAEQVSAGELLARVRTSGDKLIENCEIFDVFQGAKIPEGYKSVALSITYRSQTKTLTEKNVEKSHSKIVRLLTDEFGGSFRNA